jgi:peptidoglycan/LPS O-acetylase OafA/YrhL
MNLLDWVIEHWLVVRWVIFAIVVGSVWGTLTTILADGPSSDTVASEGWCSFCCGLGIGLFFIPLWGVNLRESSLSRGLSIFVVLILMTVSLTLSMETAEGELGDAGFWVSMFAVCAVAFHFLTSPVNALGVMMQASSLAEEER